MRSLHILKPSANSALTRRINRIVVAVVITIALAGCSRPKDFDAKPILAPVKDTDLEASEFAEWRPTPTQLTMLEETKTRSRGKLLRLLESAKREGSRLRVTGLKDGLPVTESIGVWHIAVVPTSDPAIVELKGLLFANGRSVTLNVDRDVLYIDNAVFTGTPISGQSPIAQRSAFQGIRFSATLGLITGEASILVLDDQRVVMDFDKVVVNGARAREYGILRSVPAVD